jgi:hypothetical protein
MNLKEREKINEEMANRVRDLLIEGDCYEVLAWFNDLMDLVMWAEWQVDLGKLPNEEDRAMLRAKQKAMQ